MATKATGPGIGAVQVTFGSRAVLETLPPHPLHQRALVKGRSFKGQNWRKAGDAVRKISHKLSDEHGGHCVCEASLRDVKLAWSVSYVKYVVRPRSGRSRDGMWKPAT